MGTVFEYRQGKETFFSFKIVHIRLWDTPSLLFSAEGGYLLGVKLPGQEFDHLLDSSAEVQNDWSFTATAPVCLLGVGMVED